MDGANKNILGLIVLGALMLGGTAGAVTRAANALTLVEDYTQEDVLFSAYHTLPPAKGAAYVVEKQFNLGRGKYLDDRLGFSDFLGEFTARFENVSGISHEIRCTLAFTAENVEEVLTKAYPVIEEGGPGDTKLILRRRHVSCELLN